VVRIKDGSSVIALPRSGSPLIQDLLALEPDLSRLKGAPRVVNPDCLPSLSGLIAESSIGSAIFGAPSLLRPASSTSTAICGFAGSICCAPGGSPV
jgi:hypothetical protein